MTLFCIHFHLYKFSTQIIEWKFQLSTISLNELLLPHSTLWLDYLWCPRYSRENLTIFTYQSRQIVTNYQFTQIHLSKYESNLIIISHRYLAPVCLLVWCMLIYQSISGLSIVLVDWRLYSLFTSDQCSTIQETHII